MERIAVVTGTSSGLGKASAEVLLDLGFTVFGGARSESSITHPNFIDLKVDLRSKKSVHSFFQSIEAETEVIDVFVNAGGICQLGSFAETPSEEFLDHHATMTLGTFHLYKELERFLIEEETKLINIFSLAAKEYYPGSSSHSSSDSSRESLLKTIEKEWAKYKVSFNGLYLGAHNTPLWDDYDDINTQHMLRISHYKYLLNMIVKAPSQMVFSRVDCQLNQAFL